jgi:methyl-accepting chemotaxis protein
VKGGLFARLLAAMCGVAAASTVLVLAFQERSLSGDLERAAQSRLERAATATERLIENHLETVAERYRAISGTPQFQATLEVGDAPTLGHYAGSLAQRHAAARIVFLQPGDGIVAGAGDDSLDALALAVTTQGLVAHGQAAYAVVSTSLGGSGRLVAIEAIGEATLALWSELCGVQVALAPPGTSTREGLERTVRRLDGLDLRVTASLRDEQEAIRHARVNLALGAALGLAAAFAVSLLFSRGLVRPIQEIQAAAARLGGGDLTTTVATNRRDEIGDVARAFEGMVRELNATIGHVSEAADRVDATALALSEGSRRFAAVTVEQRRAGEAAAKTAEEIEERVRSIASAAGESAKRLDGAVDGSTASFRELAECGDALRRNVSHLGLQADAIVGSVEQVARSAAQVAADTDALLPAAEATAERVEQIADSARAVSAHAEETTRLSRTVVEITEKGRRIARDAVHGMEATCSTIEESERLVLGLQKRGEEIGTILTVIEDVTAETALLALNAAIIASQAGEHGRAFGVVGDEMRALADRVHASTKEIDAVVRAVQAESASAAESILQGSTRAREGAQLIQQSEASLEQIARAARESGERMAESADATARQMEAAAAAAREMEAVRLGVDRIRLATREQADASGAVQRSGLQLQQAAQAVEDAAARQTEGTSRIGEIIELVQRAVREQTERLEQQVEASAQVAEVVRRSIEQTGSHEDSAAEIGAAAEGLGREAETLRRAARYFRTGPPSGAGSARPRVTPS